MYTSLVLIETSWNVKLNSVNIFLTDSIVLIETSWNVKEPLVIASLENTQY